MKEQIKLAVVAALGLLILASPATVVLGEPKSETQGSEVEAIAETPASDEVSEILGHYFAIRELLAHDNTEGVDKEAQQMTKRLDGLIKALQAIQAASTGLNADDLKRARDGFGPLSDAVLSYVKEFGFSGEAYSFYCSMVDKGWLQEDDQIGNPYYGSEMFECGEMTGKVQDGRFIDATQGKSGVRVYEVFGMDCPGCHGAIEKLVKKIPAVQEAEANWKEQRLTVTVRPGSELNDEEIYDAVRRANFTPGKRTQ